MDLIFGPFSLFSLGYLAQCLLISKLNNVGGRFSTSGGKEYIINNVLWWSKSKVWKIVTSFSNRLVFNWYIEVGAFYPFSLFARPNSWYFCSLQILRLVRTTSSSELVEKILRLRRSQYEFKMKFSVKVFTVHSLLGYAGTCTVAGTAKSWSNKNVP